MAADRRDLCRTPVTDGPLLAKGHKEDTWVDVSIERRIGQNLCRFNSEFIAHHQELLPALTMIFCEPDLLSPVELFGHSPTSQALLWPALTS